MFGSSLHQLFVEGTKSYLRYLCLVVYSGVQHILYCVFALFFVVLCTLCCQFLWIVHFWLPLRYSLDCPFFIAPSVFFNVYLYYNRTNRTTCETEQQCILIDRSLPNVLIPCSIYITIWNFKKRPWYILVLHVKSDNIELISANLVIYTQSFINNYKWL